jgi:hypothetical protein
MRKSERKLQGLILDIRPETNPDNLKAFLKTLGDAGDHIGDEASRQTLKRSRGPLVIPAMNQYLFSLAGDRNPLGERLNELALRAAHLHLRRIIGDLHSLW